MQKALWWFVLIFLDALAVLCTFWISSWRFIKPRQHKTLILSYEYASNSSPWLVFKTRKYNTDEDFTRLSGEKSLTWTRSPGAEPSGGVSISTLSGVEAHMTMASLMIPRILDGFRLHMRMAWRKECLLSHEQRQSSKKSAIEISGEGAQSSLVRLNSAGGERIPTLVKVAYEPMSPSPMSH